MNISQYLFTFLSQTTESENSPQIYWNLAWEVSEPSAVFLVIAPMNKIINMEPTAWNLIFMH